MSQMKWTYLDDYGGRYNVGLYHGNKTGHLLIYCDGRVVVIDFNVFKTKKYSFLINDDLCDLHVEQTDGKFAYGFEVNHDVDTPANRRRRKHERQGIFHGILFFLGFILIIGVSVFLLLNGKGYF
jgi:hypothetical protein